MRDTKINLWFRHQGLAKEQLCMLLQKWASSFFSHFPAQSPLHTKKSPDNPLSLSVFSFLAVLGLRGFFQAFSSCGQQELLSGCGVRAFHCSVFSCCRAWALGHVGSVVVALGLVAPACGIFPDQGLNPWPLHWQAESSPLDHQESPHLSHVGCFSAS